jgi:hypothetical protein
LASSGDTYKDTEFEIGYLISDNGHKFGSDDFVHFSGWNKSWDRWVMENQIVPGTEMNMQRMKRCRKKQLIVSQDTFQGLL